MIGLKRSELPLAVVGCDFRSANVIFREILVTTPDERAALFSGITNIEPESGFAALETCNRVEWIVSSENPEWMADLLAAQMIQKWQQAFPDAESFPVPRIYTCRDAAKHIMRVVAGVESLASGEAQIAGQFQDAVQRAREEKTVNHILNGLAKHAGRLAKSGARIGFRSDHTRGIHGITADYLNAYFNGDAGKKTVIVAGMGSIGRKTAESIDQQIKCKVVRVNRTVTSQHSEVWVKLEKLPTLIEHADAIVVATGALSPVVKADFIRIPEERHPLLIMDIGIPRQVSPEVQNLPTVVYRNLDDLTDTAANDSTQFENTVEQEVEKETDLFRRFCIERNVVSLLENIQNRRQEFIFEEIPALVDNELGNLDAESKKKVVNAMKLLIGRYSQDNFKSIHSALEKYWSEM